MYENLIASFPRSIAAQVAQEELHTLHALPPPMAPAPAATPVPTVTPAPDASGRRESGGRGAARRPAPGGERSSGPFANRDGNRHARCTRRAHGIARGVEVIPLPRSGPRY